MSVVSLVRISRVTRSICYARPIGTFIRFSHGHARGTKSESQIRSFREVD